MDYIFNGIDLALAFGFICFLAWALRKAFYMSSPINLGAAYWAGVLCMERERFETEEEFEARVLDEARLFLKDHS